MARLVNNQLNPWGRSTVDGSVGQEAQRNDLWLVDFSFAVAGLKAVFADQKLEFKLSGIESFYLQSVSLPELKIKADTFRRDSRPYSMPSWGDPLEACRMTCIVDARALGESSHIYYFLDSWRRVVRAGRGALSRELGLRLNKNFTVAYRYSIDLLLIKGGTVKEATTSAQTQANFAATKNLSSALFSPAAPVLGSPNDPALLQRQQAVAAVKEASITRTASVFPFIGPDLQYSGRYLLENAWLGGFKIADLNYKDNAVLMIEATFYVENILDVSSP